MKKGLLLLAVVLLLAGCSKDKTDADGNASADTGKNASQEGTDNSDSQKAGFEFTYNDVVIPMNVDAAPVIEALGKSDEYFEAASCAFQGLDKTYTYKGFELTTYPQGDKDYISTLYFLDDSVSTDKGICIGSSLSDVTAAYGDDYTEKSGEYTYTLGDSTLAFIIENDEVTSITYSAVVEGLE